MMTRRTFLHRTGIAAGSITVLPFAARAAGHGGDAFASTSGEVVIHPVSHASFVMETPLGTIYVDPVGAAEDYAAFPAPDLIVVTHEHGDHFSAEVLSAIAGDTAPLVTNPAVHAMLPADLMGRATMLANGDSGAVAGVGIEAIPAYNTTPDRLSFHPQGRDNGYVLGVDGLRIYVSGDTEDVPEMRALTDIDVAFVCMNLPFTMDAEAAADAVAAFGPTYVYPYHYRGRDNGTQDPAAFADLLAAKGGASEVRFGPWYG